MQKYFIRIFLQKRYLYSYSFSRNDAVLF